jgi:hypothetical protein
VFALAYWMFNAAVRDELDNGTFVDPDRTARWATDFGRMYLDAADARRAGREAHAVWQAAFDWGDSNRSAALEDLLLAMAAHIGHDLPLATWQAGLPAGRADDFAHIDDIFRAQMHPIALAVANEYSPFLDPPVSNDVTERVALEIIVRWRAAAWDDAVALTEAPDEAARAEISAELTDDVLFVGRLFQIPKTQTAPERVEYCMAQNAGPA